MSGSALPKHLSADNMTRLSRFTVLSFVAARWFAFLSCKDFWHSARPVGSLLPTGVCYRALRRLPGRDFHPL